MSKHLYTRIYASLSSLANYQIAKNAKINSRYSEKINAQSSKFTLRTQTRDEFILYAIAIPAEIRDICGDRVRLSRDRNRDGMK